MTLQTATYLSNDEVDDFDSSGRETNARTTLKQRLIMACLVVPVVVFALTVFSQSGILEPANGNRIILGSKSQVNHYPLKLRLAVELDNKSPEDILRLRTRAAVRHSDLIHEEYEPSDVFHKIAGNSVDWTGTLGKFGSDTENRSDGPADASRVLLNPLLLVSADIWPLDASLNRIKMSPHSFGKRKMREYLSGRTDIPFLCDPVGLVWEPTESRASVTYDVGAFLAARRQTDRSQVTLGAMTEVDFNLLNARDLNLNYAYTSPRFTKNVVMIGDHDQAVKLEDSIVADGHRLDTSNTFPEGSFLLTGSFPASVEFLLWKRAPRGSRSRPDLRFTVRFENTLDATPPARKWIEYFRASQDALCIAGVALADLSADQRDVDAKNRAIMASQRLEELSHLQQVLPKLDANLSRKIKRYVTGNELSKGYAVYSRSAGVVNRLSGTPGFEDLVKEFSKPHWLALNSIR